VTRERARKVLTPAETLGLSGAILDARVRRAVNHIADAELDIVARRLTDDARANDLTYERQGVLEPVRVMLRPLLIMPEQQSYLHHVCTRVMAALARIPDLYANDAEVRKILPLAADEAEWFAEVWAVRTFIPSVAVNVHPVWSFGAPSTSTRHMRQAPTGGPRRGS